MDSVQTVTNVSAEQLTNHFDAPCLSGPFTLASSTLTCFVFYYHSKNPWILVVETT